MKLNYQLQTGKQISCLTSLFERCQSTYIPHVSGNLNVIETMYTDLLKLNHYL